MDKIFVAIFVLISLALAIAIVGAVFGVLAYTKDEEEDLSGQNRTLYDWHSGEEYIFTQQRTLRVDYDMDILPRQIITSDGNTVMIDLQGTLQAAEPYNKMRLYFLDYEHGGTTIFKELIAEATFDATNPDYEIYVRVKRLSVDSFSVVGDVSYHHGSSGSKRVAIDTKHTWNFNHWGTVDIRNSQDNMDTEPMLQHVTIKKYYA